MRERDREREMGEGAKEMRLRMGYYELSTVNRHVGMTGEERKQRIRLGKKIIINTASRDFLDTIFCYFYFIFENVDIQTPDWDTKIPIIH